MRSPEADESPVNKSVSLIDKSASYIDRSYHHSHNNSMNSKSVTICAAGMDKPGNQPKEFWVKQKVKYELKSSWLEVGPERKVFLGLEITNLCPRTWHSGNVFLKGHKVAAGIEQPMTKRVRSKNTVKLQINLKKNVEEISKLVGEFIEFEICGYEKMVNQKFYSDHIRFEISMDAIKGML